VGRTLLSALLTLISVVIVRPLCYHTGTAAIPKPKINFKGGGQECPPHTAYAISIVSSTSFLSFSSLPVSSNEFVSTALPFSTLVIM
jgi:hypothetical protein